MYPGHNDSTDTVPYATQETVFQDNTTAHTFPGANVHTGVSNAYPQPPPPILHPANDPEYGKPAFYPETVIHATPMHMMVETEQNNFTDDGSLSLKLSGTSRINFVRKVYGILCAQLLTTALWISIVAANRISMFQFMNQHVEILVLSVITYMVTVYALGCYREIARRVPLNYCLLAAFTVSFSYIAGMTTVRFPASDIIIAAGLTASMVIGLTTYAINTKTDFSAMHAFIWSLCTGLIVATILAIFIRSRILVILLGVLTLVILSIFIVYDTQLILGNQSNELSIDDYIFAAMMLYIDIMRMFLEILRLLEAFKK